MHKAEFYASVRVSVYTLQSKAHIAYQPKSANVLVCFAHLVGISF